MQGVIFESLESRTLFSAMIAGELVGTLPQTLLPAASDKLALNISNSGDAKATGGLRVNIFVGSQPGDESILVGSASRQLSLKPGRSTQFNVNFKLPASLADGQYFLTAQLAAKRVVTTSGSMIENILDASPITVQPPTTSLVGEFVGGPINVGLDTSGDDGVSKVSLRVTNPTAAAIHGTIRTTVYLSYGPQIDNTAQFVGVLSRTVTVFPGQSRLIEGEVTIPAATPFGTYNLLAVLGNHPTGVPHTTVFASQLLSVSQGVDNSAPDTGPIDTGDGDNSAPTTNPTPPTTQDNGDNGGATTQPTTDPGDDGGGDSGGDDGGDDGGGDDGGGDDGGDC